MSEIVRSELGLYAKKPRRQLSSRLLLNSNLTSAGRMLCQEIARSGAISCEHRNLSRSQPEH